MYAFLTAKSFAFVSIPVTVILLLGVACGGRGPEELEISVKLADGQLIPGTIQVGQGDTVTLKFETDEPGEIHLHGYDIEKDIEPNVVVDLMFVADATGRFRITFHEASDEHGGHDASTDHSGSDADEDKDVGYLEVRP